MYQVVTLCLLVCIFIHYLWRAWQKAAHAHPLPPAYPGLLPIIGHTHMLLTDTANLWKLIKMVSDHSVKQGGLTHMKFGTNIHYLISDPEDAAVVANTCLVKHFLLDFIKCWLGEGLLTGSGEHWYRHRKMLSPNFSLPIIHGFLEVFNSQSRGLLNTLDIYVGKGQFYPTPHIRRMVLGTSYMTTFGNTVEDEVSYPKYINAADEMFCLVMTRFQKFWLQSDFIYWLLGYKKMENELLKTLHGISDEILEKKKMLLNEKNTHLLSSNQSYEPLLDQLLQQHSKNNFNDQEISEEVHTAFVSAFETTSHSLEIIFVMIGSFPKVQEKMYEEIMQVLGTDDRDIEKEDLQKLVYTEAVIKESLRLTPPGPVLSRYVDKDVKLKNYTMRAGNQCCLIPYALNRHPSWGPDADQFRPERWLNTAMIQTKRNTEGSFGLGKRSCIGKTYAMTSMKVVVAHMLRKYVITADHNKVQFKIDITLKPVSGHEISLERRSC